MNITNKLLLIAGSAVLAASAGAQFTLTSRTSTIHYNYVYGGGPDVTSVTNTLTDSGTDVADSLSMLYQDSRSGVWAGLGWEAGVYLNANQAYYTTTSGSNTMSLAGDFSVTTGSYAGGIGTAVAKIQNPGNAIEFLMQPASTVRYRLSGHLSGGDIGAEVRLSHWDGVTWATDYTTWSLPGLAGSFSKGLTMNAGVQYKLYTALSQSTDTQTTNTLHFDLERSTEIHGNIWFGDYANWFDTQTVDLEFWENGVLRQTVEKVRPNFLGDYTADVTVFGNFEVFCKGSHWLRRSGGVHSFQLGTTASANFNLINGDIDNNNEVGLGDYGLLSAAYGTETGDPAFNPNADLNGNGDVSLGDYGILSTHYGEEGE